MECPVNRAVIWRFLLGTFESIHFFFAVKERNCSNYAENVRCPSTNFRRPEFVYPTLPWTLYDVSCWAVEAVVSSVSASCSSDFSVPVLRLIWETRFARLWKAAVSFVVTVRMEHTGSQCTDFNEICLSIFWKSVENIQASLKPDKNNGQFTWRTTYIYGSILRNSS